jgi:glycosyltransferase involved in cell wall biosynthesis
MGRVIDYIEHGYSQQRFLLPITPKMACLPSILKEGRETVLVIAHEASRTGAPVLAWNLVKRLNTQYNVVVLLKRGGSLFTAFQRQAVAVVRLPEGTENLPDKVYGIVERLVSTFRVKYAIANSAETRLFIAALEENRVPVIALVHEFAEYTGPVGTLHQVYEAASTVVFPSSIVASSSLAKYPVLATRGFRVVPQGLCDLPIESEQEFDLFRDDPTTGSDNLNDEKAFLVVGMGAVQIRKGVDLFIAIASLTQRLAGERKISFLWVGHGYRPDEDLAYSAYLRDQIIRSDLGNRLEILDEVADLKPIYDRADLLLLTSRLDPLPNVAIEAALRGLPVICFDRASGLAELLEQNDATRDLVVPYLDCNAAAHLVSELAVDPVRLRKRSEAIQSFAKSTFDMARYVDAIDRLGRAASSRASQVERDTALIVRERAFDPKLFIGSGLAPSTYNAAVLRYLNKSKLLSTWSQPNAGLMLRRPFAGFHPFIYAAENASFDETTGEDPLAHFLRTGRPNGRWTHSVIRPEDFQDDAPARVRAAIHGHFHYPELLEEFLKRLAPNRTNVDLFLTTNGVEEAAVLRDVVSQFSTTGIDIRVVPNRGRDIGPLLSELADELQGYDIIGHMHGKRSKHITQHGDRWRSFLWDHLLGSAFPMVDVILKAFATDPTLGLVFPEDPHLNDWNENRLIAEDLARKMGITDPLPTHFDFPIGTMFWARPAALQPLFSLGLRWNDYPIEPLSEDGTILHALERLVPFAANEAGFRYATTFVTGSTR